MRIYLKNNHAKLYPDPILNDGALALLKSDSQQEEQ